MKFLFFCAGIFSISLFSCSGPANKTETAEVSTTKTDSPQAMEKMATGTEAPMPDSATMMKNWTEYMTPSPVHKMMESWNGRWEADISMWQTPGSPVEKSKSVTVNKMLLGNRYQQSTHTGNMMGMPFEGISTMAYDNAKKIFISTWIDNMGTGLMTLQGPWNESSKTISLTGNMVNPSAGNGKEERVRETFTVIDDHTQLMEMFGVGPDGKEFKNMEIKFTR